jgi:hypothetical protein
MADVVFLPTTVDPRLRRLAAQCIKRFGDYDLTGSRQLTPPAIVPTIVPTISATLISPPLKLLLSPLLSQPFGPAPLLALPSIIPLPLAINAPLSLTIDIAVTHIRAVRAVPPVSGTGTTGNGQSCYRKQDYR